MIVKIILLFILILVNGLFSAAEMAFFELNTYELNKDIKNKNKKAIKIFHLLKDSSAFLSAIQIVITLSGFLASAFAADSFAREIAYSINPSWISMDVFINLLIVIITIILSYFTLVFGELVPKRIGLAYPKTIAYFMVNIIYVIIFLFKPFIFILGTSTNFILKLLRIEKPEEEEEEEIKSSIVDANLEEFEKKLLLNVFEFNDTTIEKAMVKKENVVFLDVHDSKEQVMRTIKEKKYTRFPVVEDGNVIGVLNVKDLLIQKKLIFSLKNYVRKITTLSSDTIIDDAFLLLNGKHEPIAKVVKDGEWIGIITIEDIIEEILGNVFDEYDREELMDENLIK